MATGVARPRAHGQLITRTDIPRESTNAVSFPAIIHTIIVISASTSTVGTNTPDTLSAILAIGAFPDAASPTMAIIWERVVSSPTLVARHLRKPDILMVAALTLLSGSLSTGILSPDSADSSTALFPSITCPSTGMLSPGLTTNISPTTTSSAAIFFSSPSRITFAVLGASSISPFMALVVLPLEYASRVFPMVISVTIMAADSKYRLCI